MSEADPGTSGRRVRSRYRRDTGPLPHLRVTDRDLEIIEAAGDYRLLSTSQVSRLFFSSVHKARKRLAKLWQHGLVDRRFQPVRLGEGNPEILYTLSTRGARCLAAQRGATGKAPPAAGYKGKGTPLFVEHTLMRNDFRIALTLACRERPDVRLLFWRQDKSIKEEVTFVERRASPRLRRVSILADGYFALEHGGKTSYFYVEIDRGTVSGPRMRLRFAAYHDLWLRTLPANRPNRRDFRVLILANSSVRSSNLQALVVGRPAMARADRFFFATADSRSWARPDVISAPIWTGAHERSSGSRHSLLEL